MNCKNILASSNRKLGKQREIEKRELNRRGRFIA
jgi:hypothetical protein